MKVKDPHFVLEKIEKPDFECKEIIMVCDNTPLFSKEYITFLKNIASYYTCPMGLVLQGILSEKILNMEISDTEPVKKHPIKDIILTNEQQEIADSIQLNTYCCHLIKGITGSGKTEIYHLYMVSNTFPQLALMLEILPY